MACLPLIKRELRVALRKQRPAQGRFKIAAFATAGAALFLGFGSLTRDAGVGRGLEKLLCAAGLFFVLRAPRLTAGVLAEERRNQTLGLLFLSGLNWGEVFAGKFFSSALIAFTNLLAIFPMLALPFLIGGVSYGLFLAIVCALPGLMFFALAISILASVMTRDDAAAIILANALGALLCLLGPGIYLAQTHLSPSAHPSLWWLRTSPGYGPWLVWRGFDSGFRPAERGEFWQNLAVTMAWSGTALAAAGYLLNRVWRDQEAHGTAGGWRGRWREFLHGDVESRHRVGRLHLDKNPFVWLILRDRTAATLGWLVIGAVAASWLLGWAVWGSDWAVALNFFLIPALLNIALSFVSVHAAAQTLAKARRDGSFELLLTTPLGPNDIVLGTLEALRCQFTRHAIFIQALNALMMLGGLAARPWNGRALIVYFCVWSFFFTWTADLGRRWSRVLPAMWISLNCGRPAYAVWRASGFGKSNLPGLKWYSWIWLWNIMVVPFLWLGLDKFPSGTGMEVVVAVIATSIFQIPRLVNFLLNRGRVEDFLWDPMANVWRRARISAVGKAARRRGNTELRLINEFREIVREPLPDPNDPRFKKWNVVLRFPIK